MDRPASVYQFESARAVKHFVLETDRAIRAGRLIPGDKVDIAEYADRMKISTGRVRSALHGLEVEGLLAVGAGGNLVVTPVDTRELEALFELRFALEPELLSRACRTPCPAAFDEFRRAAAGRPIINWQDDEIYALNRRAYLDYIRPTTSSVELGVFEDLVTSTQRATRMGFKVLSEQHPCDLVWLAEATWELVDACVAGKSASVQRAARRLLRLVKEVAWQGARPAGQTGAQLRVLP
jgi:DNA-binding GntR family transcriptional regulator